MVVTGTYAIRGEITGLSLLVTFEGLPLCVVLGGGPTNGGTQK